MKYTNKHNLHPVVVDFLKHDDYDHNPDPLHISTTSLIKPVRATLLEKRHAEEIVMDISTVIPMRLGTAIHNGFEVSEIANTTQEIRESMKIHAEDGTVYTVSGKYDIMYHYEDGSNELHDIKTTSVNKYLMGEPEDYIKQLSIYKLLNDNLNIRDTGMIHYVFTDWNYGKSLQDKKYPQVKMHSATYYLWSDADTFHFVKERIELLHIMKDIPDDHLPRCTDEELWKDKDKFAVQKKNAKRATRVFNTYKEAKQFKSDGQEIVHRIGKAKRCNYCNVQQFCNQYREMKEKDEIF